MTIREERGPRFSVEELKRAAPRAEERRDEGRTLDAGQDAAGQDIHRLDQLVELAEVDGGLRGVLAAAPVGLDVAVDDGGAKFGGGHRGVLREIREDRRVRPARAGLDLLGPHEDLGMVTKLVRHLDHRHEAGVHADHVHLPPEDAMGGGEHALQLLVVEAVRRAVVVGDAPIGGPAPPEALAGRVEDRGPASPAGLER